MTATLAIAGAVDRLSLDVRYRVARPGAPMHAAPCACPESLEFRRGSCSRCGRWLAWEIGRAYDGADLDGLERLEMALHEPTAKMRLEAEAAGALESPAAYQEWLEEQLAHP